MKHQNKIFLGAVAFVGVIYFAGENRKPGQNVSGEPNTASLTSGDSVLVADKNVPLKKKAQKDSPAKFSEALQRAQGYFQTMMRKDENVEFMYNSMKNRMSNSLEGQLVATYAAQVLGRNGSAEYSTFYSELMTGIKLNSEKVFEEIMQHDHEIESDPFTHQIAINLVADLDVPPDQKAKFMGRVLERSFEVNESGNISPASAALTIALIQMKKANISVDAVRPYVERGIVQNQGDSRGLKEYLARVNTYYPGI